jgi:two-component sensor histidine kinase
LEARLIALSNAHGLLTKENWEGADIYQIVAQALEVHASPERVSLHGPSIFLPPKSAVAIAMGMHELATNAAKYGALSNGAGRVSVSWSVSGPGEPILTLEWKEQGGPRVSAPTRRGFGSRLIERSLSQDLDGRAALDFDPQGLVCIITTPLGNVRPLLTDAAP